jgi:hypothetical protein
MTDIVLFLPDRAVRRYPFPDDPMGIVNSVGDTSKHLFVGINHLVDVLSW